MKNKVEWLISNTFISVLALLIFSCNTPAPENSHQVESGSDFLKKQGPPYDPQKIDPIAPVIEIRLQASGNTMSEMKFDTDTIHVKTGCTVQLLLKNNSTDLAMMHNFVLTDADAVQQVADAGLKAGKDKNFVPDIPVVYTATKMTLPGESDFIRFPAPPKGIYKFICTYPGHYSMMQGWFFVE